MSASSQLFEHDMERSKDSLPAEKRLPQVYIAPPPPDQNDFKPPLLPSLSRDQMLVVSVVYLEQLYGAVTHYETTIVESHHRRLQHSTHHINSRLVTISLETAAVSGSSPVDSDRQQMYLPTDVLSLEQDFVFVIEFSWRNLRNKLAALNLI